MRPKTFASGAASAALYENPATKSQRIGCNAHEQNVADKKQQLRRYSLRAGRRGLSASDGHDQRMSVSVVASPGFKPTRRIAQTYAGNVRTAVLGNFEDAA